MAKRFTDTDKWKKKFIRTLQAPYKVLWLYILDACDHAGIWHVDLAVASIMTGFDIDEKQALEALRKKVYPFDDGEKWFIPDFIDFQYGALNPDNRVHLSVINLLKKYKLMKVLEKGMKFSSEKPKNIAQEPKKERKITDPANLLVDRIWKKWVEFKTLPLTEDSIKSKFMAELNLAKKILTENDYEYVVEVLGWGFSNDYWWNKMNSLACFPKLNIQYVASKED